MNVSFVCDETTSKSIQWTIENYRGIEGIASVTDILSARLHDTFNNKLILPIFTTDLHDTTLYCGYDDNTTLHTFYLKTYSKCDIKTGLL